MTDFLLNAEVRTDFGKAASRRMRREETGVPAVVYGAHEDPVHIVLPVNIIRKALESEAFYSSILTLNIAGKKTKAVIRDIQRHPFKPKVQHMDFLRVSAKEAINMTVPIHFVGEEKAPGVTEGGVFSHNINELEVRCLPGDLPEFIEINVANMKLDDVIHLSEIKAPKGVEILAQAEATDHAHDHAVVSLHVPHIAEEPEEELEAAEGEEVAAEGEAAIEGEGESEEKPADDEAKPAKE